MIPASVSMILPAADAVTPGVRAALERRVALDISAGEFCRLDHAVPYDCSTAMPYGC